MLSLDQETLKQHLSELSLKELKQALGAGVPGEAWRYACDRKKELDNEIKAIIEKHGKKAHMETEVESPPEILQEFPTDDKNLTRTFTEYPIGDETNGETGVQTSKKRGNSDSGEVQE
jgi:hypothetical protein